MAETNLDHLNSQRERRSSDRFPIDREVRYKMLDAKSAPQAGNGRTLDMSSGGILFTTENNLSIGKRVELSVNWPAQLNNSCRLKLVALGRVVRAGLASAAIIIEKYEFRTQGTNSFQSSAPSPRDTGKSN